MRTWLTCIALGAGCGVAPAQHTEALSGARVLWLDLAGATTTQGTDDATHLVSALGVATVPAFDAAVVAPQVAASAVNDVLVDRVRAYYLPYNVDVETQRPPTGDYAAVLVGGTSAVVPDQPPEIAGVGPVDCGDSNPRSVGFAFSDSAAPATGGIVSLGATIAHEAGHGFGLEHTSDLHDPMYSVAQPQQALADLFSLVFESGAYSSYLAGGGTVAEQCDHADPIDHAALLQAALGSRSTTMSQPPTVSITSPPDSAALPPVLPLAIDATDDVAVVRVEVYRDLELIAVLAAPYTTTITLPVADSTTLTVEAVDDDGQRATTMRTFRVDPTLPAACSDALACTSGTCTGGVCVPTPTDLSTVPSDLSMPIPAPVHGSGCTVGDRGTASPLALFLVALWLIRSRRFRTLPAR